MKRISIIMPVFNKGRYLEKIIKSILKQTFEDFELIIVDDGSTDCSAEICDYWEKKDSRIRVRHMSNRGVSNARNTALDMAQGQYITFIDADDGISQDYLENLYRCITETNVDLVISGHKKVWENILKEDCCEMQVVGKVHKKEILPHFAEWQKRTGIFGYCCAKIFSKELVKGIYFDSELRLAEDFDFYLKLYDRIDTIYFDNHMNYYYLQDAENSSLEKNDYNIDYRAQLKINLRYKNFLELNQSFNESNKKIVTELISNYFYFSLFYCEIAQFDMCFQELYDIYCGIKIKFVNDKIFAKWMLFLLKNNQKFIAKKSLLFYRHMRKKIRGKY